MAYLERSRKNQDKLKSKPLFNLHFHYPLTALRRLKNSIPKFCNLIKKNLIPIKSTGICNRLIHLIDPQTKSGITTYNVLAVTSVLRLFFQDRGAICKKDVGKIDHNKKGLQKRSPFLLSTEVPYTN